MELANGKLAMSIDNDGLRLDGQTEVHKLFQIFTKSVIGEFSELDFKNKRMRIESDGESEMIVADAYCGIISARHSIRTLPDGSMEVLLRMKADWPDSCPEELYLHSPFIAAFNEYAQVFPPACPFVKEDGSDVIKINPFLTLPLAAFNRQGYGYTISFPVITTKTWWNQNRNHDFYSIRSVDELRTHRFLIRLNEEYADICRFVIHKADGGWLQAFDDWRTRVRNTIDFSQYSRGDFGWYKKTYIQHFTYMYSREIFDYEKGIFDIDKLLTEGEAFGGYDGIILWHQYPRLGIDERSQWDFFHDLGLDTLMEIVERAHAKGIRVFLPYKPWDVSPGENSDANLSELIAKTDVDGIFFDTMDSVPSKFRESCDKCRSGVVFCTEGQPADGRQLEIIVGSWDQHWNILSMPECNLLRYLLPEHVSPMISRWNIGLQKDELINRAVFNGTGLVIWQDIFGVYLPYSAAQKNKIKKWKAVLCENADVFYCLNPIPMYPAADKRLFCNYFRNNKFKIFTVYNESIADYTGKLFDLPIGITIANCSELWQNTVVWLENSTVFGSIEAKQVIVIRIEVVENGNKS